MENLSIKEQKKQIEESLKTTIHHSNILAFHMMRRYRELDEQERQKL